MPLGGWMEWLNIPLEMYCLLLTSPFWSVVHFCLRYFCKVALSLWDSFSGTLQSQNFLNVLEIHQWKFTYELIYKTKLITKWKNRKATVNNRFLTTKHHHKVVHNYDSSKKVTHRSETWHKCVPKQIATLRVNTAKKTNKRKRKW